MAEAYNCTKHDTSELNPDGFRRLAQEISARQVLSISLPHVDIFLKCTKCEADHVFPGAGVNALRTVTFDRRWMCSLCNTYTARIVSLQEYYA